VLAQAVVRELTWGLPAAAREVRRWRAIASRIPDETIRRDALHSLEHKRGHTDGAALFCILAPRRDPRLLRLLVAYEIMWDFLDSVNERGAARGQINGRRLHLSLVHALDASLPICDYYLHHSWREDGGYLRELVRVCRETSARLPSYEAVRPLLLREAWRAQVLAINHDPDPAARDRGLREWALRDWPDCTEASWYELTGAASASLTVHVLFALAANPNINGTHITGVYRAYNPWISAATTMLDSWVDRAEDERNGDHSYVAHYPPDVARARIAQLIRRSTAEAARLPDSERHILLVACMAAMYLSKDSARTPATRQDTQTLIRAGGPLTRALLPILRLWRVAYAKSST
jgi:tetraprenyl-beta-curcumene synthase